ncbi:MAG TPA: hypothetical protein ENG70_02710, partial [Candidatus Cloacimonetes bacterium]|nr:hypothetical protein [Candidatus Cloacimonadota bacterium]HEX37755.1 hypothetical protein [Candidatus Cloacimonadota bacterium]
DGPVISPYEQIFLSDWDESSSDHYVKKIEEPDLIIQDISWSPSNPKQGDTVTINVKTKNQGSVSAGGFYVCYYVDGSYYARDYVSSLSAGSTTTTSFSWTAECGSHSIKAVADCYDVITESNETNNAKTTIIKVEKEPKEIKFIGTLTGQNWPMGFGAYYFKVDRVLEGSIPVGDDIRVMVYMSAYPDPLNNYDRLKKGDKAEVYAEFEEELGKRYDPWVDREVWAADITGNEKYYVRKIEGEKSFIIRNETTIVENEVALGDVITLDASSIPGKDYSWKIAYQPIGPTVEKTGIVAQYWIRYLGKINIDLTVASDDGKKTAYSRIIEVKPIPPYSDDQSVEFRIKFNKPQCDYKTEVLITERVPILVSKYSNENEGINANIFQIGPASKEVEEWLLKKGITEAAIKIIEKVIEKSISSVFLPLTTLLDIINLYDTWMQGDLVLVQHTTPDGTVYHIHVPIRRTSFEGALSLPPDQTQPSDEWVRQKIIENVIKKAENNGKVDWKEADISKIALINQSIGLEGDHHYRYEKAIKPGYNRIEFRYEPLKQQWDNVIYPPHAIIKACANDVIPLKDIPVYIDNSLYRKTDRFGIVRVDMTSISPGKHIIKVGDGVVFESITKEVDLETGKEIKFSVNFDKIDQYKYKHCIYALVHFYSPEESPFGYSVRNYIINDGKALKTVFSRGPSSDLDVIEKYARVSNLNVYIGTDFTLFADRSKGELIIENEKFKILRYPKITKNFPGWVFTILIKNPDKLKESNAMEHAIEYFITNFDSLYNWQKLEQLETTSYTTVLFNCPVNATITDQYGRIIADNGTNEITDADMIITNETKIFYLPADLTYSVDIDAYDTGTFNFTRFSPVGNEITITKFENIPVTSSTKASVEIEPGVIDYTMSIDYDGDGETDEEKSPDVNETIAVTPTEENIFDTGAPSNPYPSIAGTHTGTITPNRTITVNKLYTYPCAGTGGHTESIELYDENGN